MSGDLRAKKNARLLNKTGGNKKGSPKSALNLQTPSCDDENVDFTKEYNTATSTEDGYEDVSDDRIITTKPIRKTKRRELNKYKQLGRHHRQQTPPPPSYYGLDEDASKDEYENGNGADFRSTLFRVFGGLVILSFILGACVLVVKNEGSLKVIGSSESLTAIIPSNIILPDLHDVHSHLNIETVNTLASSVKESMMKGYVMTGQILHQILLSSKETCSNIMNFINTVIVEIRNRELFKDTSSSPLEASNDPNDDSQDYTPELNEWIESFDDQKDTFDENIEKTNIVEEGENSLEVKENLVLSKEPVDPMTSMDISENESARPEETILVPSFQDVNEGSSIKLAPTLESKVMDTGDKQIEKKGVVEENGNSVESRDNLVTLNEPVGTITPMDKSSNDHAEPKETIIKPSIQDIREDSSIKLAPTLEPKVVKNIDKQVEKKDIVEKDGNSEEPLDNLVTSNEPARKITPMDKSSNDHMGLKETITVPSFQDIREDSSITLAPTLEPKVMDGQVVDEPVIEKTTVHTLG